VANLSNFNSWRGPIRNHQVDSRCDTQFAAYSPSCGPGCY